MSGLGIRINNLIRKRAESSPYSLSEIATTSMKKYLNGQRSLMLKNGSVSVTTSINIPPEVELAFRTLVKAHGMTLNAAVCKAIEEEMAERGI